MKVLTYLLYYGYVITLVLAGAWGVFFAAFDQRVLFHLDVQALAPITAASLVSQYRFLRAVEFGFGAFSVVYRREIFTRYGFNRLFLTTMGFGVAARVASLILDGPPLPVFNFFLIYELVSIISIYAYSRRTLEKA
ncbi:MAG TPA: DUF4345 family protein [Terriglobia bacterium]|nr:DUF4345 family protein [Terriglobia bacterium]